MHRIFKLEADFRLQVVPSAPKPSAAIAATIDAIWAAEKRARGTKLYNGKVYSLVDQTSRLLTLVETDYRHFLAQRRALEIAGELKLRPVGVTGILTCRDGVVLGRRAGHLASDAGLWEPAPAGSLDRLDPAAQLLEELAEELGLKSSQVTPPNVLGLVEDAESRVVDILYRLETALDAPAIEAARRASGSDEYQEIAVVAPDGLAGFLAVRRAQTLPALAAMLRLGGMPV